MASEIPSSQENLQPPVLGGFPGKVIDKLKQNLVLPSKWAELNGAMGDLGTYIPIVLALTLSSHINLGTTLIFTGVYNFVTGVVYGVPMPVQPMKSIAAVAISDPEFGIPEMMAAGIWTGGVLFVLGATGLMWVVYKLIPLSVVRGIQLSQGLNFAMSAAKYIRNKQDFAKPKTAVGSRPWLGMDGLLLAIFCTCFIIVVNGSGEEIRTDQQGDHQHDLEMEGREHHPPTGNNNNNNNNNSMMKRFVFSLPSAFIIFLLGVIIAIVRDPEAVKGFVFGPSSVHIVHIPWKSWKEGFIKGAIPQLPLSILNSVIAVCKLSSDLFPTKHFSVTSISMTVGMMNLVGCWFGAIPTCHGAGGLAGQYKFGGRSGGCVAMLGISKLLIGLVLGSSIIRVLNQFPVGMLGVLLLFAGIELAMAARDMTTKEEVFVMLLVTSVSLVPGGSGASIGFIAGIVGHLLLQLRKF